MKSFVYMFLRLLLADPTYISAFKDLLSTGFEKKNMYHELCISVWLSHLHSLHLFIFIFERDLLKYVAGTESFKFTTYIKKMSCFFSWECSTSTLLTLW